MSSEIIKSVPATEYKALSFPAGELPQLIADNCGGANLTEFDLDKVSCPTGGGTTWEVPTLGGTLPTKEIIGVIVAHGDRRVFWEKSIEENGGEITPPDCSSADGRIGRGTIASTHNGVCATCPKAQYGSDRKPSGEPGRGQACAARKLLFVILPDNVLPLVMNLPPTSIGAITKYMLRLTSAGLPCYGVVTKFTLKAETNPDGNKYAICEPTLLGKLSSEDRERFRSVAEAIKPIFSRQTGVPPERSANVGSPNPANANANNGYLGGAPASATVSAGVSAAREYVQGSATPSQPAEQSSSN